MQVIIGAGSAGLIIAECLKQQGKEIKIVTDFIGGQEKLSNYNLGPRILHKTPKTEQFVKSLGIKQEPKEFKIGYYINNNYQSNIDAKTRENYNLKTRGSKNVMPSSMSEGKNTIIGWDVREINLIDRLIFSNLESIQFIKVDKTVLDDLINDGNEIISTINYNALKRILGLEITNISALDAYFTKYYAKKPIKCEFNYIYLPELTNLIKRVTIINEHEIVVETVANPTVLDEKVLTSMFGKIIKLDVKVIQSQLFNCRDYDMLEGIKLEGRFARLNHSIRMDTIIDKYYEVK